MTKKKISRVECKRIFTWMIVKMWLQPLLYCKGPTRSMWRWANRHWGMEVGCGSRWVWRWILLPSQCRQDFAQLVTSLARPCQTNLEDPSGQPPRRGNAVQMQKKSFRNFAGTMGWKTPVETSPTRHWAPCLCRLGRYNICKLFSEMNAKWRCCCGELGAETRHKAVTRGVLDLVSQVRDVVLINVYLDLGNPRGSGFWNEGYMGKGREMERSVYEQPGNEVDRILSRKEGSK